MKMSAFAVLVGAGLGILFTCIILYWVICFAINDSKLCKYAWEIVELLKKQDEREERKKYL